MPYALRVKFPAGAIQAAYTLDAARGSFAMTGRAAAMYKTVPITGLPSWVPAMNTVAAISTNTLNNVAACPTNSCSYSGNGFATMVTAWNSGTFSPDYGTLGAYVICGGGDGDYHGNEVYVFPLDTRAWVRINNPSPYANGTGYLSADLTWGEWQDGTPGMPHTYGALQYLPPTLGGGAYGSVILTRKTYWWLGIASNGQAHKCNLQTGVWSRASSGATTSTSQSQWAFDSTRQRFIGMNSGPSAPTSQFHLLGNFAGGVGTFSTFGSGSAFALGGDASSEYIKRFDAYIVHGKNESNVWTVYGYDAAASLTRYTLNITGDALPQSEGIGMAWCDDNSTLYLRSDKSGNEQYLWSLTPPVGDWRGGAWTCTRITMSGVTVTNPTSAGTRNGMWQRLRYAPKILSLVWCESIGSPVYAYRIVPAPGLTLTTTPVTLPSPLNIVAASAGSKHLHFSYWNGKHYLMAGDHKKDNVDSPEMQDGRQEIYSLDVATNTSVRVQNYYIYDPAQVQMWVPDDAFSATRNDEIWCWQSATTVPTASMPASGSRPSGSTAPVAGHTRKVMAWNPTTLRWRVAFDWEEINATTPLAAGEFRSGRAWRCIYDAVRDRFIIPCWYNGLVLQIINGNGTDGTTRNVAGYAQTYGNINANPTGVAWDVANRILYIVDSRDGKIYSVNVDTLAPTYTGKQFAYTNVNPGEATIKIGWHPTLELLVFMTDEQPGKFHVWDRTTGTISVFGRSDGWVTNTTRRFVGASDLFYDPATGDMVTIGGINFAYDGDSTPPPGTYWRHRFTRS